MPEPSLDQSLAEDLMNPLRWPYLPLAKDDQDLQDAILTVMRTEAGQKMLCTLIMKHLLSDGEAGISPERVLGRQDVVKDLHRQYNQALYGREARTQRPHVTGTG